MAETAFATYLLPPALIGRADLARLVREVETVDGELESQKVRTGGDKAAYHLPTMSQALSDFLSLNKLDITNDHGRMVLKEQLRKLKDKAPIVHMTFAVDADPPSLQKLVAWMRENAHPHTLLSVGLQPALVGGVYMRTPNHVHDFSMKAIFSGKHSVLINKIEEFARGPQVPVVPAPPLPQTAAQQAGAQPTPQPQPAIAQPQGAPHG